jgi:hypothetical protein
VDQVKTEKFCVFCGKYPDNKNKEHVLPRWLIEMTGDPKRIASFGIDFARKPFAPRQFSFDALTFPACTECNSNFGHLEAAAEPVVRGLLKHQALHVHDLIILLDWLDKVRVGLWLGYFYLDKNPLGINPRFYIQSRLGRLDRMVAIIKIAQPSVGLTFIGPQFREYQLSPTCFGLRINELCLLNASGISLCSRRLGFPFVEAVRFRDDLGLEVSFHRGSERIMYPVERRPLLPKSVALYQPVFRVLLESDSAKEYVETEYVSTHTVDFRKGYGKLFVQKEGAVRLYPDGNSSDWEPSESWATWEMIERVPDYVYESLSRDFENAIDISSNRGSRKEMRQQAAMTSMLDRAMLRKMREAARVRQRSHEATKR